MDLYKMDSLTQIQTLESLQNPTEHDKLMLGAPLLRERVSHLPCYANRPVTQHLNSGWD